MPSTKPICFFVMPFAAEMHYFYLYVRRHIEDTHNLECQRADDRVTTLPISEKVRGLIQRADVVIADCTGRNPNVFYELGLAHGLERKVILITRDAVDSIPTDLRLFEFIKYDPSDHITFLDKLDKALNKIFEQRYETEFEIGEKYFSQFATSCPAAKRSTAEEFAARYRAADASGEVITPTHILSFIIKNHSAPDVMEKIVAFEPKKEDPLAATTAPEHQASAQAVPTSPTDPKPNRGFKEL